MPVSLSALVSVEGADNFQERYSPAIGVVVSRMVADRLAVYASPGCTLRGSGAFGVGSEDLSMAVAVLCRKILRSGW